MFIFSSFDKSISKFCKFDVCIVPVQAIFYVLVMLEVINPWQECILDLQPRQRKDDFDFIVTL